MPVPPAVEGHSVALLVPFPRGHDFDEAEHPQLLVQALQVAAVQPGLAHTVADEQLTLMVVPWFAGLHQVFALQLVPVIAPKGQYLPCWQIFGS